MKRTIIAVAVVFALGLAGTAAAAKLITSKDIKNGTIKTVDLSRSAKSALKGQRGAQGPEGPQGPQGPSAVGQLTRVESGFVTLAPGDVNHVTVNCPSGMNVVSGGYESVGADSEVFYSDSFGSPNSWSVGLDNFDSSVEAELDAVAFCAPTGKAVVASHSTVRAEVDKLVARQRASHR